MQQRRCSRPACESDTLLQATYVLVGGPGAAMQPMTATSSAGMLLRAHGTGLNCERMRRAECGAKPKAYKTVTQTPAIRQPFAKRNGSPRIMPGELSHAGASCRLMQAHTQRLPTAEAHSPARPQHVLAASLFPSSSASAVSLLASGRGLAGDPAKPFLEQVRRAELGISCGPQVPSWQGTAVHAALGGSSVAQGTFGVRWLAGMDEVARRDHGTASVPRLHGSGLDLERLVHAEHGLRPSPKALAFADVGTPVGNRLHPVLPTHYGGAAASATVTGLSSAAVVAVRPATDSDDGRRLGGKAHLAAWVDHRLGTARTRFHRWGRARSATPNPHAARRGAVHRSRPAPRVDADAANGTLAAPDDEALLRIVPRPRSVPSPPGFGGFTAVPALYPSANDLRPVSAPALDTAASLGDGWADQGDDQARGGDFGGFPSSDLDAVERLARTRSLPCCPPMATCQVGPMASSASTACLTTGGGSGSGGAEAASWT